MAQNKVMKLWTAIVTAFLALCTALGLVTATTAAATPQTDPPQADAPCESPAPATVVPALSPWAWSLVRSLPPTMKQRIRAEAHGMSPGCRQRPASDTDTDTPVTAWSALTAPLQT